MFLLGNKKIIKELFLLPIFIMLELCCLTLTFEKHSTKVRAHWHSFTGNKMYNCVQLGSNTRGLTKATIIETSTTTAFNPLYTGRLFRCYMLDKSICHFRGVRSISSLLFYF